jgi:hypothetical protein
MELLKDCEVLLPIGEGFMFEIKKDKSVLVYD